jgi:hypothetical protein
MASATVIRVPQDRPTIQAGINATAINGDTVLVAPGTYIENIMFSGRNIKIISSCGPDSTIITKAISGVPVVRILHTNNFASLEGFTVRDGVGNGLADGIYLSNSSALIKNNIIRNNAGGSLGAGLWSSDGGAPVVINNIFTQNSGSGRTVEFVDVNPVLERNLIVENANESSVFVLGRLTAINNTIARNNTSFGIQWGDRPAGQIINNIISDHSQQGITGAADSVIISFNDFFNNTFGAILNDTLLDSGNIHTDPQFLGGQPYSYELDLNSPCIDAGDPATPVPEKGGVRADIGALEFTSFGGIFPANNEIIALRKPQFIWRYLRDTTISAQFRMVLDTSIDFAYADSSPALVDTVWRFPYQLKLNQAYFWKVFALSDSGDTIFSNVKTFTVSPPVVLNFPVHSSRVFEKQPTFIWHTQRDTSIPDNFTYQVLYSNDSAFVDTLASPVLSDTFWQAPTPLYIATTYYWKVLAFYSGSSDTLQSALRNFLVAPTTIFVPGDRPTIQEAINVSWNGDTVLVQPGVYQQNIFFNGKRIKLFSETGPESTVLAKLVDGAPLVSFSNDEDSNTVLRGFTLQGARAAPVGAAINIESASPTIENNYLLDNAGNLAVVSVWGGNPKFRRNLIADNNTSIAAIGFFAGTGGEVVNNTIANNTGDGIRITPGTMMRIKNNILAFNTGYGIRSIGGINNTSTVSYNDNYSNTLGTYFATIPTTDEIYQNPKFRGGSPFDYHLLFGSPCIDSGDPGSPVPPGGGARMDIGVFEFVPMLGDLNGDGMFAPSDVVLELNCVFLGTGNCPFNLADTNCDSQLTPADVVLMLNLVFLVIPLLC